MFCIAVYVLISCQHEQVHLISIKLKYFLKLSESYQYGSICLGFFLSPPPPVWFEAERVKGTKTCYAYNFLSSSYWEHWLFVLTFRNAISDKKKLPKGCSQNISSIKSSAGNECSVQAFYI